MSYHPAGRSGDDDDDDFEEHDPTPYGGGYDISLTYGCPLPPSEDICYPASSSDDDSDNDPPQISSNSEPPSYADEDLDDKYEGYRRPKPRPSLAYDTTPGAGGHGSAPPPTDSGVNRPGYGGESNYGGTGHVWRPDRDSGYDRPGLDYGSNYGQQGGSEHGSEYGRNPQHEGPSAEHGFGYRSGDGRKSEGDKPSTEYGFGNGFGYQGRTKLDGGKPSYGEEGEDYGRGSEKPSDGGPSYESRKGEGSVKPSGDMGESRYGDEGYGQVKYDMGRLQIIKNSDIQELGELGSGAFGSVFHGKWRGTEVAIKRIQNNCSASKQKSMRDDFLKEAITLAELHHPKVVAFYGVVLDGPGDSVATVTEYMVHGSLRTALHQNEGGLDERKRLLIAMDVACGMEYLHSKKIVHFDLKSDNLLVDLSNPDNPKCKVADLGLSKVKLQTLISGGMRGTPPWMAPELFNGRSKLVSEKVDVFSFGIVIWELLTGEEPYDGLDGWQIIGGIVSNTLRPPVPDNCDPDWRSLMERCWSAEPSDRPSFTEIVKKLQAMLS